MIIRFIIPAMLALLATSGIALAGTSSTATTLAISPPSVEVGNNVNLTAVVQFSGSNVPIGVVMFTSDISGALGTIPLNEQAQAILSTSALAVGLHTITASFTSFSQDYADSSTTGNIYISPAATFTVLQVSPTPSALGEIVTLSAFVVTQGASPLGPTGSATFNSSLQGSLGTVALDGGGQAVLQTNALVAGRHNLNATYNSDTTSFTPSDATVAHSVGAQHSADRGGDLQISLPEVLRVVQFYNALTFHCDGAGEDGFNPGAGNQSCTPHAADYAAQDWTISLAELLRVIQFFNLGGYFECPTEEDGFCAGPI